MLRRNGGAALRRSGSGGRGLGGAGWGPTATAPGCPGGQASLEERGQPEASRQPDLILPFATPA